MNSNDNNVAEPIYLVELFGGSTKPADADVKILELDGELFIREDVAKSWFSSIDGTPLDKEYVESISNGNGAVVVTKERIFLHGKDGSLWAWDKEGLFFSKEGALTDIKHIMDRDGRILV
ncbi:hypothetical protein [Listeria cornellensis]|uniref:Uncharacterized protein n=1 Tax=Listeria cornellensis FSL F6-0969 TaxID=1265820 RepID=W7C3V0_9LIST|nr:hypothetical protein [Listeria cornellensis]EUJ27333.1 hypothetical protein PCORN_13427 [Listeria cornellensis FSL F6-0969]